MRIVCNLPFIALLCAVAGVNAQTLRHAGTTVPALGEAYARLPLSFEKRGDGFVARGQGYSVALESGKAAIRVFSPQDESSRTISLEFVGSLSSRPTVGGLLPGKVNYIQGNDPSKWRTGIPTYSRVTYADTYPGVDVVYYGNQKQLEFDLVVRPGADPRGIGMKIRGGSALSVDASGALEIGGADNLRIELPQIYQEFDGKRKSVSGHWTIKGPEEVALALDSYDRSRTLVIDPTIVYSTLFGGGLSSEAGFGIAVDASDNILLAGYTYATDFPTASAAQSVQNGSADGFIAKINAAGTALIYSTYLGGSSYDSLQSLAVDSSGSAWVTGYTESNDFPVLNASQATFGGGTDTVVAKLDLNGVLKFSTYLGGSGSDLGYGIAVDSNGNGYVAGYSSASFPTTAGVVQTTNQGYDGFAAKYSTTGTQVYATLLGGSSTDAAYGIAVDSAGDAYVTGYTASTSFTGAPAGGAHTTNAGGGDAFVAKLNSTATAILYFTFLGGSGFDEGASIAVDSSMNAYISGTTTSTGIATSGAAQTVEGGAVDGFAAKLNATGSAFSYVTYLGGVREDYVTGLALDGSGNLYLAGYTDSANFPTVSPLQPVLPGSATSLYLTTTYGSSWAPFDGSIPGAVSDVSFNPQGSTAVVLTESGIYRTTNSGGSWTQQSAVAFSLSNSSFVARSPASPGTIYATTCCSAVYQSTDDGVTWSYKGSAPTQAQGILADPLTVGTVYIFGYASPYVFKSTDGGATWNPAATGLPAVPAGAMTATSDGTLYVGTYSFGIYTSTNQGGSWNAANSGLPPSVNAYPHSLSASGTTVYLADGPVYVTTNGGANWTATAGTVNAAQVAVSAQNASILYVLTSSNQVEESADGGATWSSPGAGLPGTLSYFTAELVADPASSTTAFVVNPVNQSAFAAKLNSSGSSLTWSTYLGGTSSSQAYAVATDGMGDAFLTGFANAGAFPITSQAFPSIPQGAFITKISDATAACSLALSPGNQTISPNGQTLAFNVLAPSGCPWNASSSQSWAAIVAGSSGTGTGAVTIQAGFNSASTTQTAVLTVGNQSVTITQPSGSCVYSLDQSSYPVGGGGGTVTAVLTASAGCPWVVTNNYPQAISISSGASGTGNGTIVLAVTANPSAASRTFSLTVGSAQIQIAQTTGTNAAGVTLASSPNPSAAGQAVELTATIFPSTATGTVTFADGATTLGMVALSGGSASLSVSTLSIGTHSLTATYSGDASDSAGASAPLLQTVASQVITFGALTDVAIATPPFTISATASSGLTVNFTSNTTSVCTVSGSTVTIVDSGGCSITASQPGNGTYAAAAPVTQTFTVLFSDVPTPSVDPTSHYNAINLLAQYGVTEGCAEGDYCPNDDVTRAEMAVFIIRSIFGGNNFSYSQTPYFADVAPTDFGFQWIQAMYELGITKGCGPDPNGGVDYCPNASVTRIEMAVFIIKARLGATANFNYPSTPYFTDVPSTNVDFEYVQRMKMDGITAGCTATTYCPDNSVTRDEMAQFIMVGLFNQLLPSGTPAITQISPSTLAPGATGTFTITAANTNFVQGTTVLAPIPGVSIGTVTVNSPTTLTVQLSAASNAAAQPQSLDAITGAQEAVLPNGLTIQ